jgi:hypothetical protein
LARIRRENKDLRFLNVERSEELARFLSPELNGVIFTSTGQESSIE